jgi:hypothetical protein
MTVRLDEPLAIHGSDEPGCAVESQATGYVIVMGVNAPDLAAAATAAQKVALCPKREDGNLHTYEGRVEDAEIGEIEKSDLDDDILQGATKIDEPGVYYSTGLMFFDHHDGQRKWWEFWKLRPTRA